MGGDKRELCNAYNEYTSFSSNGAAQGGLIGSDASKIAKKTVYGIVDGLKR